MFHIFDAYQLKLTKNETNKVIIMIALSPPKIATITHNK